MNRETKIITPDEIARQHGYISRVREMISGENTTKYALVRTFGCQQNEADSERLAGMAEAMGYEITDSEELADLILVNTCAIREHAELKALSITGQFKHLKAKKPSLIIGICGCMVSQEHRLNDIKNKYPYVDFLFGTGEIYRFPELLCRAREENGRFFIVEETLGTLAEGLPVKRSSDFKAWLSIMYGCNNFCTYCVVPYVRGRERSRKREDVLAEARELVAKGYKEITLLGQNVNSYGKDLDYDYDFADLLADICAIEGDFIVRFMTSHPKDASKKLVDTIAANPKVARQFHLPLQSGSNAVLKAMNRRYTRESYLELIDYMKAKIPDIALTTDIIVGFPGETEEDFADTLDILSRVRYDNIYSFIYSPRKGTPASEMDCQIPPEIQSERFSRLLQLQHKISNEINQTLVGTTQRVLVEGISKNDAGMYTGRCESGRLVHFKSDIDYTGKIVDMLIERAETFNVFGSVARTGKQRVESDET
ncbi:MAG: tRNA (N6-isopentenyl adenosine(37)-C2)-methylthiotransferase MiaB [Clostridia bacterium]|nr:tRNA (N6-isopentenyl adenosine(37)-C2)-methylthiotransferase MiaB [Clostridia bacterium]